MTNINDIKGFVQINDSCSIIDMLRKTLDISHFVKFGIDHVIVVYSIVGIGDSNYSVGCTCITKAGSRVDKVLNNFEAASVAAFVGKNIDSLFVFDTWDEVAYDAAAM